MYIQLKPEHEQFIQAQIASGKYQNPEEIIDIAFRLLKKLNIEEEISATIEVNRQSFLELANKAYEALRNNPEAWEEELEERQLWEKTLADGLEEA
ncbi:MAG: type II toxin-antitoxin system ParD family antitoxin [Rivularia sp. (in: cyanobacteria)]